MLFSRKDLSRLIIPLMIEQLLAITIGLADSTMVSAAGEAAVSGISLVDTVNVLLIQVFAALSTGGAVISAQYLGREDYLSARASAKQLYQCVFLVSSLIMALSLAFRNQILRGVFGDIEPAVESAAQTYFVLTALSFPFLGLYNAGAALFRSMGNSKVSLVASIVMNVINLVGNYVTMYYFDMGVFGIALATLISRATGAVFITVLLLNKKHAIHIENPLRFEYKPEILKNILRIGVPSGIENGIFQVGKVLVASLISSFGTIAITANAVTNTVAQLQIMPGSAIGLAMLTVVGRCIGANDEEQAKLYTKKLMVLAIVCTIGSTALLLAGMPVVFDLYHLTEETRALTRILILIHSAGSATIWCFAFALPNALRAAADVKFTMISSIACMWIFRIGASYLLGAGLGLGVIGVWIAMVLDWIGRGAMYVWRVKSGKWLKHRLV